MPFKCFTGTIWNCNSSFFSSFIVCVTILICTRREKRRNHIPNKKIPTQFPLFFWYDDDTTVDVILASQKYSYTLKLHVFLMCYLHGFPVFLCTIWFLVTYLLRILICRTPLQIKLYPKDDELHSQVPSLRYMFRIWMVNGSTHCIKGHPF